MREQLQEFALKYVTRSFSAGSTILYQGEVPRSGCVIRSGLVKVTSISPQGDEQIVVFHVDGEFFPASWVFGKSTSTLFFYEAVTDCEIAFIPRNELIEYLTSTPELTHCLLDYFTTNYAAFLIRVNALEQPRARDKLLYTLYYLAQRYGTSKAEGVVDIPIQLTHQQIASLVGLTRETTAMEMSKLKKSGVLQYRNQLYSLRLAKLLEMIGEDSFKDIQIS